MIGIYKIVSPTKRVYIGSSLNVESRWRRYKGLWSDVKQQQKLWNSLNKYGAQAHVYEVLEETTEDLLHLREQWWLDYYKSKGYKMLNIAEVTGKPPSWEGKKHSDVTKYKQRLAKIGKPRPKNTKEKISKSLTGRPKDPSAIAKMKSTKSERNSWQQGVQTKIDNGQIQRVIGYNPVDILKILYAFTTISEGCNFGFSRVGIGHCVTRRQTTHRGVAFLFEQDYIDIIKNKNI